MTTSPNCGRCHHPGMMDAMTTAGIIRDWEYETASSKLQHVKDKLLIRLDEANEKLGALNSECANKTKKIESMKQQASKWMSQVYELTDQFSIVTAEGDKLKSMLKEPTSEVSGLQFMVDKLSAQTWALHWQDPELQMSKMHNFWVSYHWHYLLGC